MRAAVLLLIGATGCLPKVADLRPRDLWDGARPAAPADGLILRTALAERPPGDEYLSRGLWATAGRPLTHELATLLARNGVRVGVVSGIPAGEFAALLNTDDNTDGALIDAKNRAFRSGASRVVPVNGPLARADFDALPDLTADPKRLALHAAECGLCVTAAPAQGDQVRLRCEFQVQHGDRQSYLQVAAGDIGLSRQEKKPLEPFPALAFAVTLSPGDALIVGPTESPHDTLGGAFFLDHNPDRPRQRVLVIRPGRALTGATADDALTVAGAAALHAAKDR